MRCSRITIAPYTTWSNMSDDYIKLTESEIEFLKYKFNTEDPDEAVDLFVEILVLEGSNPMDMKLHIEKMMKRYQC